MYKLISMYCNQVSLKEKFHLTFKLHNTEILALTWTVNGMVEVDKNDFYWVKHKHTDECLSLINRNLKGETK